MGWLQELEAQYGIDGWGQRGPEIWLCSIQHAGGDQYEVTSSPILQVEAPDFDPVDTLMKATTVFEEKHDVIDHVLRQHSRPDIAAIAAVTEGWTLDLDEAALSYLESGRRISDHPDRTLARSATVVDIDRNTYAYMREQHSDTAAFTLYVDQQLEKALADLLTSLGFPPRLP